MNGIDRTEISFVHRPVSDRLEPFLETSGATTPYLVIDSTNVAWKYFELKHALPEADIFYAVKANPHPEILRTLAEAGASFDVASPEELGLCMAAGVPAHRLSFGNTVKKASAISYAYSAGLTLFTCDCSSELEKLAANAPGADVMVRLRTDGRGAEWPLSRKFGCSADTAFSLLLRAASLGLKPYGISFHVGSQQTNPTEWEEPIARSAHLFRLLQQRGIELQCLNIGGGFPAHYIENIPQIGEYGRVIAGFIRRYFGSYPPRIMAEPGRYLVAESGVIQTEVVLIARRSHSGPARWVYVDCGRFGGLAETMDEAIRYPLRTKGRTGRPLPVILAGPTCDSADILYERNMYSLPEDLREGDRIQILSAGAYTHMYSSVGFNGFPPLRAICI